MGSCDDGWFSIVSSSVRAKSLRSAQIKRTYPEVFGAPVENVWQHRLRRVSPVGACAISPIRVCSEQCDGLCLLRRLASKLGPIYLSRHVAAMASVWVLIAGVCWWKAVVIMERDQDQTKTER